MKQFKIIFSILFIIFCQNLFSEGTEQIDSLPSEIITFQSLEPGWFGSISDSNLTEKESKKNYLIGSLGMVFSNVALKDWNQYFIGAGWAQVRWEDVCEPWEREVEFDTDWYWTNFVLHPYQGNLYYTSARNSNLNVAESFLITVLGSAMWEYFCELNDPSINDFIYTSFGGVAIGEMLYRLSLEAQDVSPFLSYVINPMRLITDPFTGHKPNGPKGKLRELSLKGGIGAAGTGTWFEKDYDFSQELFPGFGFIELYTVYGDPYKHSSNIPFSQFELQMGGGAGLGSGYGVDSIEQKLMYDIHIFSNGMLFARNVDWGENLDTTLGIVLDYDFMWHSFMEFSSLAPGFAIKQRYNGSNNIVKWQFHLDALLLGTSDFYYFRRDLLPTLTSGPCRDYGYTFGGETVVKFNWENIKGHSLDLAFNGYAMYKFPFQTQNNDDTGWEFLGFTDLSYEFAVSKAISVGIANEFYFKKALYDEKPDLFSILDSTTCYIRYNFM